MSAGGDFGNPLRKFKLVFLGEQSGESPPGPRPPALPSPPPLNRRREGIRPPPTPPRPLPASTGPL